MSQTIADSTAGAGYAYVTKSPISEKMRNFRAKAKSREKRERGKQVRNGAVLSRCAPAGLRRVCETRGNQVPSELNCWLFTVVTKLARVHGACTRARTWPVVIKLQRAQLRRRRRTGRWETGRLPYFGPNTFPFLPPEEVLRNRGRPATR